MIAIKSDKFVMKNQAPLTSVFVITDEFPKPSDKNDRIYEFILKLADKHKAKKVNLPVSYRNERLRNERTIKISFETIDDKNEFINDLQTCEI